MQKAHNNVDWKNWPNISTPLSQSNLNAMDQSIGVIDDRVIVLDTTKANQSDLLTAVARLEFDDETGILTIYYKNGLTDTIDTGLSKLTMNWDYDNDPTSEHYQDLVLEMADGTYKYVDLSALINNNEFTDTDTINITVTNGVVSADVIDGSITDQKLETNYLANITTQANHAAQAASAAATSESNASDSADDAEDSALVSEGWAVGKQNGEDVEVGSDYFENNSKYYKEQAEASATSAEGSATSANLSAGSAQNAFVGASNIQTDVTNMRNAINTWQQQVQQNTTLVASNTATAQTASNTAVNASNSAVAANSSAQSAATRAEAAAERAEEIADINIMTTTRNGIGKPDGVTITVDENGTLSAAAGVTLQFVDTLPPIGTALESVIYCLKTQSTGSDIYEEYVVGYDEQEQREWVQIGDTSVNLSGYATTYYVDTAKSQVQGNLNTHINGAISTENGVHGIRFYNNKLQRWIPNTWIDIETGGMDWEAQTMLGSRNLFSYPYYVPVSHYASDASDSTYYSLVNAILYFDSVWDSINEVLVPSLGCLVVEGRTLSSAANFVLHNNTSCVCDMILDEGTYILSGCPAGGSANTYCLELFTNAGVLATDVGTGAEFTVVSNTTTEISYDLRCAHKVRVGARIVIGPNQTLSEPITFKPMIKLASDTDRTFVPYSRTNADLTHHMEVPFDTWGFNNITLLSKSFVPVSFNRRSVLSSTYLLTSGGDVINDLGNNEVGCKFTIPNSSVNPTAYVNGFSLRSYLPCWLLIEDINTGVTTAKEYFFTSSSRDITVSAIVDGNPQYAQVKVVISGSFNFSAYNYYLQGGIIFTVRPMADIIEPNASMSVYYRFEQ